LAPKWLGFSTTPPAISTYFENSTLEALSYFTVIVIHDSYCYICTTMQSLSLSLNLSLSLSNRPISTYCLHLRDFAICHSVRISFPSPLHLLPCFYTTTSGLIYELFGTRKFEFSVSFSNYCDFGTLIADE